MSYSLVQLSTVADVFNGKTPSKAQQRDKGFPVLKIKDVSAKRKFRGHFESFVDESVAFKSKDKFLKLNDTLILNAAHNASHVGSKQYRAEIEVVGSLPTGEWLIARTKDEKSLDSVYLSFYLRSDFVRHQISLLVKGIHLYPKDVARLNIPLPPLETQKQIAAVLEKADQLRKDCQQMEQELNSLAHSVFIDMFGDPVTNPKGWELESLGALCDFENGDRSSNYPSKGDITETGKLFLSSADIGMGDFQIKSSKFISQEKFDSLSRGKCQTGDVLMTLRGNGLGRCCVFDCEYDEGFINAQMVIIRPDAKKCSSRFLVEQLNCKPIFNQLLRLTSGSAQPQFSAADVKGFQVLIPPLSEQKKYHKVVDRIKRDVLRLRTQYYDYENLFSSLMQKAFKGELNL
ncbi:restriction endonuclease subunit S [Vibrio paucivorans]|uniref:Restriction endonuclease subunit S n=1 Tax=Vibrio paucivorans TaxID=2829489 RepID=A0A9X3CCA0_9VIBR|nr:restriction endonuclease subunit S [Vibrio paucivorans]MCW8333030.1 restriction endonuclease subunit S [Vibrio paucivorans]